MHGWFGSTPNTLVCLSPVGRPGSGKTTLLRAVARKLADELYRKVVVVDTSNEIGGDSHIPHPCLGEC